MTNLLTQKQVEDLMVGAGMWRSMSRIAGAISMCESPWSVRGVPYSDFDAIGDQALANDVWGYSYSGFQIRSLRAHKGTGMLRDEELLGDPVFAAKSARTIKLQQGWTAWSTYTSGMYKAYLQDLFPPPPGMYVVMAGDTLSAIAAKMSKAAGETYNWEDLARVNGLHSPYRIFIGQHLLVPWTDLAGV